MTNSDSELLEEINTERNEIVLRKPDSPDGPAVFALVDSCKPLDVNSMYCNLLQCSHFRDTAVLAQRGREVVGFISGYRLPDRPDVLFVWQVAVSPTARGCGLASRMLNELVARWSREVRFIHTSITPSNEASWNTFRKLAREHSCELNTRVMFDRDQHFAGLHDTEELLEIGPLAASRG